MKKWIYKHYKWDLYEVLWLVIHTETEEELVLYKALYWEEKLFVRPFYMFFEKVNINWSMIDRFIFIWNKKYENI